MNAFHAWCLNQLKYEPILISSFKIWLHIEIFQYIEKNVWKGVLKLLQAFIAGFMVSYHADDKEGIGSIFQMLELIHTHFTLTDVNNNGRKGSKKSNSPKHDSKVNMKKELHSKQSKS